MKTYGEMEAQLHAFLTSALEQCEWSASRPRPLYPSNHGTERGWAGLRAGLDAVARRKESLPCQESNPGRPARGQFTTLTQLTSSYNFR
jgi:hypothetical protein